MTLLRLQGRQAPAEAKESLEAAADRVQTIARVHRRLEVSDERVVVNSKHYLDDLCEDLRTTRLSGRSIELECTSASHSIAVEKAVPLGLIVNELVTNAAKHAFVGKASGRISVSFFEVESCYRLRVSDDGVGYDPSSRDTGLGQGLLKLLAIQLGAELKTESDVTGTVASIDIPKRSGITKQQLPNSAGAKKQGFPHTIDQLRRR